MLEDQEALDELVAEALESTETRKPANPNQVKTFISQTQLQSDLSFSHNSLDDAMMRQASLYAHYGTQSAKAQLQADRMKNQMELVEAQIDKELREEAAAEGKKITEAQIEKAIRLDSRYQRAVSRYNESKMVASMTKTTTEAFTQRRDMLVQIGKDLREERLGEVRVRASQDRVESLKDRAVETIRQSQN